MLPTDSSAEGFPSLEGSFQASYWIPGGSQLQSIPHPANTLLSAHSDSYYSLSLEFSSTSASEQKEMHFNN